MLQTWSGGMNADNNSRSRFKAAWCSAWEIEPVPEVFGEVDVVADSLVDMADKIIKASDE